MTQQAEIIRKTWDYGDNFVLVVNGEEGESWSTSSFTVEGFIAACCSWHGLDRNSLKLSEGVDDLPRNILKNHQTELLSQHKKSEIYDPRKESGDVDPDEFW